MNMEKSAANTVSFADKVRGNQPHQINISDLLILEMKGSMPSIRLTKQAIERGRRYCQFSLIGRPDFNKIKLKEVKKIALNLCKEKGDWKLVPLGKGFFMIRLVCEEDLRNIMGGGPWRFGDQILCLSKWTLDFDRAIQRSFTAFVWIKFPKLGQQYWYYEILMCMGRALGSLMGEDKHTLNRDFSFYASVLIEINLAKPIPQ
ncbi:hypothetical protein IFM89_016087 [Coptis chinensis]|uniref:DUF4283 domain-containing protein n=1 Tax=Coptis chinensis TaxID=261450 RepID=A0A835IQJ1_9MAGN|nr:hypothetical protein IFM89_016087 [Coptis chinensis]